MNREFYEASLICFQSWNVCLDIKLNIDKKLTINKQNAQHTRVCLIEIQDYVSKPTSFSSKKKKY